MGRWYLWFSRLLPNLFSLFSFFSFFSLFLASCLCFYLSSTLPYPSHPLSNPLPPLLPSPFLILPCLIYSSPGRGLQEAQDLTMSYFERTMNKDVKDQLGVNECMYCIVCVHVMVVIIVKMVLMTGIMLIFEYVHTNSIM